jgi:putative salt-induced outer membrane protein
MQRHLLALPLLLAALPSFAQNPPPAPAPPAPPAAPAPGAPGAAPPAPTPPVQGELTLGYLSTKGNTDTESANGTFALLWSLTHWSHKFDLSGNSASSDALRTAESYAAKYKGKRPFDGSKSYLFTALDWSHDRFSAYDEQTSASAGYGRVLIDRGRSTLNGEIGAGYREATRIDQTEENESILRLALDYALKFTDKTGFKQSLVIESGSSNTTTEAISALRANLIGKVGLVISFRIKNNSNVPPGVVATDRFTSIALAYAF